MPNVDTETKAQLVERLTQAFAEATSFPADIFGIRFCFYPWGEAASGGHFSAEGDERPYLHMLLYSPRLKRKAKVDLVWRFTEEFVAVLKKPAWRPVIHLCEHPYDNVGVDGQLLSDAYPELAGRSYYYGLTDD
ncbi:MAG: hypothetical protein ABIE70_02610 [bacterium]